MALLTTNSHWVVAAVFAASSSVPVITIPHAPFSAGLYVRPCELSLAGSPCSLALQNRRADALGLMRIRDVDLEGLKANGTLVRLPQNETVRISPSLQERFRWCLPATRDFILEIAGAFYARYGKPLQINSAVRTVERQEVLMRTNMNAARGETPERRSPHLTGSTIDIAKGGFTEEQREWLGAQLLAYEAQHRVEATEEFKQAVFHVMVFR